MKKVVFILFPIALFIIGLILQANNHQVFSAGEYAFNYFAAGDFALGVFSAGKFSAGIFSIGIFSVGIFSVSIFNVAIYSVGIFVIAYKKRAPKIFKNTIEENKTEEQ